MYDYRAINYRVMCDTKQLCETLPELQEAIRSSIAGEVVVPQEEVYCVDVVCPGSSRVVVSGCRSFEAAKKYKGKKVAVLNFANSHSVGGAPFSAGAQEESLCRCSTLYPCLEAMRPQFYQKHIDLFNSHQIDLMGNDDLIYTPDVVVFKSDERTDPVEPKLLPHEEWYKVDVITCAAPELRHVEQLPEGYEESITSRIRKILDVATLQGVEVLILGAWGCSAFRNPIDIVARVFRSQLAFYCFDTVEFALAHTGDLKGNPFACALGLETLTQVD